MWGQISHWTKWWMRGERWASSGVGEHPTDRNSITRTYWNDDELQRERSRSRRSSRFLRRRRSDSLDNNFGSPTGSRASSIAADRAGTRDVDWAAVIAGAGIMAGTVGGWSPIQRRSLGSWRPRTTYSYDSVRERWDTHALERPIQEPPVLDYRKFEEGGRMYDSINRHPETKKEDWYEYTDAEIEIELLGDYHSWITDARLAAQTAGNEERVKFYEGLQRELDIEREGPEDDMLEIRERMFLEKQARRAEKRDKGKRVQEQFDPVRKMWRDVDSDDSDWDESEWMIFGDRGMELREREQGLRERENALREREMELRLTEEALRGRRGTMSTWDTLDFGRPAREGGQPGNGAEAPATLDLSEVAHMQAEMAVPAVPRRVEPVQDVEEVQEVAQQKGGLMSCFKCCFG